MNQVENAEQPSDWFTFTLAASLNQPKFCPNSTWDPNGTTFAGRDRLAHHPRKVFITAENTTYVVSRNLHLVSVWFHGDRLPSRNFSDGLNLPESVFPSPNGDIYVSNDGNDAVNKWTLNTTNSVLRMSVNGSCLDVFVDIANRFYCSVPRFHQVIKRTMNGDTNRSIVVAGTGQAGSLSDMLDNPYGIFVDTKFNLYVADCRNNRVQFFEYGSFNGATVVGRSKADRLRCPYGLALDVDQNIFIVDSSHHRIVRSGVDGFQCILGCSGTGSSSDQFSIPRYLSFDPDGNIFVTDTLNNRIQKFLLASTRICGRYDQSDSSSIIC